MNRLSEHASKTLDRLAQRVGTPSKSRHHPRRTDRTVTRLDDNLIAQVRDAADIVSIIGEHVDLRRTGSDYRGPCPFHDGKDRNFAVSPERQLFHCFVCDQGGDVFAWVIKRTGGDFPSAVREVAQKVGISLPAAVRPGPDPHEPLYSAAAVTAEWYARQLREDEHGQRARRYLQGRGFDLDRLLPYGLGFAPGGHAFVKAMQKLGIEEDVLLAAGLAVHREDGSLRPRFWNRLVFPIRDIGGRVVGFGGRVLGDTEPKYLNSPDSALFSKRRVLYHLYEARPSIRKAGHAIIVEGYFDVLRLALSGIDNVVAPLGTNLTAEQSGALSPRGIARHNPIRWR